MHDKASQNVEELEILREQARTFGGKTAADMGNKAWEDILGSWPYDIEVARLKDPAEQRKFRQLDQYDRFSQNTE
jgi:hypothetical protein